MAAVARAMHDLVSPDEMSHADLQLLAGMVVYLRGFPRQEHHPKEELHLHRHLRAKAPGAMPLLETLESQHQREYELVAELEQLVADALDGRVQKALLAEKAAILAVGILQHIGLEEREVFPLAEKSLSEQDWSEIATAFASNSGTSLVGVDAEEFRSLFRRIANLAAPVLSTKSRSKKEVSS